MFGSTFYHASIRRYITLFGTLFNEIYINRYLSDGSLHKLLKVPITYGPKDRVIARIQADPNLSRPFAVMLPYMSFELHSITYDPNRKLSTIGRETYADTNKDLAEYNYNPVPYNLGFTLNIMVKNAEDGAKIIEQIVPYFTPDWTATIRIIDSPEILIDVPTILGPLSMEDKWDGAFTDRRSLTWTLPFVMKGYLYGPVRKSKIIKVAKVNMGYSNTSLIGNTAAETANMRVYETITVTPGLTANGEPTSNSELTVPYSQIDWNDDFGYIEDIEYFPQGKDKT